MPRWFHPADTTFDPQPLPEARDGAAYTVHGGRLYLLGGWAAGYAAELSSVVSYNPSDNSWTTHAALATAGAFYSRAVSDDVHIYALKPNGNLLRYDPALGDTDLGASGVAGFHSPALVDGRIYCGLTTPTPRYYDIGLGTWHDAPGTAPFASTIEYAATIERDSGIIISAGLTGETWLYTPATGRWDRGADHPEPTRYAALVRLHGVVYQVGGETAGLEGVATMRALAPNLSEWGEPHGGALPAGLGGHAAGTPLQRLVVAGGYDYVTGDATSDVHMYGAALDTLEGELSVPVADAEQPPSSQIMGEVDVIGGPGVATTIYAEVQFGGYEVSASAVAEVSVPAATEEPSASDPLDPISSDANTIIDPADGSWDADVVEEENTDEPEGDDGDQGRTSSYSISHNLGQGMRGRGESPYPGEFWMPAHVPRPPLLLAQAGYSWQRGGEITFRREYADIAAEEALATTILPELMPLDHIRAWRGAGATPICLFPIDADLCEGIAARDPTSGEAPGPDDPTLPTALWIAQRAVGEAGVALVLMAGPGLWAIDRRVGLDYRTEGKTAMQVVSELLLIGSPRYWYTAGTMHLDGRVLPPASAAAPGSWWGDPEAADPYGPDGYASDSDPPPPLSPEGPIGLPGEGTIVHDHGMASVRELRFVSSPGQGFMTPAQVRGMIGLYEAGQSFELETDLLVPLGEPARKYVARFDADTVPQFTAATGHGDLYYFDMLLWVRDAAEPVAATITVATSLSATAQV